MKPTCRVTLRFCAAHRLPNHPGKCHRLHGHNYRLTVSGAGRLGANGMVVDFGALKALVREWLEGWDHHTLLWVEDRELIEALSDAGLGDSVIVLQEPPTAEVMVQHIAQGLVGQLNILGLERVSFYLEESPGCGVLFRT